MENLKDLFKPNPYNVDPNFLKVGDIIWANHQLMVLTEKITEEVKPSLLYRIHGQPLFKMKVLISNLEREFTLYDSAFTDSLNYVKFATDEEIATKLAEVSAHFELSENISFWLPNYDGGGIRLSSKESEGVVSLDLEEAKALRDKLNEILD